MTQFADLPESTVLHIFSFFNNSSPLATISEVNKYWHRCINRNEIWLPLIREEYRDQWKKSGKPAKNFYQEHVDARVNTFYLIGNLTHHTMTINIFGIPVTYSGKKDSLLKSFPNAKKVNIFVSFKLALTCADLICKEKRKVKNNCDVYFPIFKIKINSDCKPLPVDNDKIISKDDPITYVEKTLIYPAKPYCYAIPRTQINYIHSIFYQPSMRNDSCEILLNEDDNQKLFNPQKKNWNFLKRLM